MLSLGVVQAQVAHPSSMDRWRTQSDMARTGRAMVTAQATRGDQARRRLDSPKPTNPNPIKAMVAGTGMSSSKMA
jgi:hypothetical protein